MKVGDVAPDFELYDQDGNLVSLESFRGDKNVVLCFYPKNKIFACPSKKVFEMARGIVQAYPTVRSADSVLFAISVDTIQSQKEFVEQYDVPYGHLADPTKQVCKQYAGLNIVGLAKRTTFVIDKKGIIRSIFTKMDSATHGSQIISALEKL